MKLSKSIGSLVLIAVLLTSISPLASAEEQVQTQNSNVQQPQDIKSNKEINENKKDVQTYVGWTYFTKKAIKGILSNKGKLVGAVKTVTGNQKAANAVSKNFDAIDAELRPLLKLSEVPANSVADAVYRGLVDAGVKKGLAGQVKVAVKEGIDLLV
ncbi:hypothetical protein [Staphylococcus capitis]|uniref:hypothetical protein n=1 Tax=Staphylococcus capitis TaxID=29388 RepID=UPI001D151CA4|nr:hypothetical protein [Staphylococcus capitis]MCC3756512.1 hypothetical protein [Staphylococcus capitis]MDH8730630.1 hypothetical protein [Staphylococcus capitis]MDH8922992.1 hypothetical protein [Staphylococcus capitis]MDH8944218.1 hypothetical protein [Staphylococcus capitis]MDH9593760.1 hypothetical protein [Staphylococcus capitis]